MAALDQPDGGPRRARSWDAVVFDLDGTIIDSAQAVTHSVAAALRAVGAPEPDEDELLAYVGPPLRVGLRQFAGLADGDLERAVKAYRQVYGGGVMFDAAPFDGVPRLLETLHRRGYPLAVATSKAEDFARGILEHLGLDEHFAFIAGAQPDGGQSAKDAVVGRAVRGLAGLGYATDKIVMIGDREHDVAGAARWDIPCIFVSWGYGRTDEANGAHAVVHTVAELADALETDRASDPGDQKPRRGPRSTP